MFRKLSYWSHFTVLRWTVAIALIGVWAGYTLIGQFYRDDDSLHWRVMQLWFPIIAWSVLGITMVGILFSLIYWIYVWIKVKKNQIKVDVKIIPAANHYNMRVVVTGLLPPVLGSIRMRSVYANKISETPVVLYADKDKFFSRKRELSGESQIHLHDRGSHDIWEVHLLCSDMFRFIELPILMDWLGQLITLAQPVGTNVFNASPQTTEEQLHRIEMPRKVEGEYLNYKDFESGDDVRRIMWKVYARTGQLVVRIPETMDPYASHVYFYTSFYNGFNIPGSDNFLKELLNAYKDHLRSAYEGLLSKDYEVRLIPDQMIDDEQLFQTPAAAVKAISLACWREDVVPSEFVNPKKAGAVCVSSCVPVQELGHLLNQLHESVPVVVVALSGTIPSPLHVNLKTLFFIPEPTPVDGLKRSWLLHPLRKRLQDNENKIIQLLKSRANTTLIR